MVAEHIEYVQEGVVSRWSSTSIVRLYSYLRIVSRFVLPDCLALSTDSAIQTLKWHPDSLPLSELPLALESLLVDRSFRPCDEDSPLKLYVPFLQPKFSPYNNH